MSADYLKAKYASRRRFENAAIAYFQLGGNCKAELEAILEALRQSPSEREPEPGSGELQP